MAAMAVAAMTRNVPIAATVFTASYDTRYIPFEADSRQARKSMSVIGWPTK